MGSSLAPVLANLFLGHYENIWLTKYQGPSLPFTRRYVNDTFCLFNTEHDVISFLDFLNSQHPSIKFTMEKETHKVLAFLDICINNKDPSCLFTSVHHEGTFIGLLTNFFGFTTFSYKIGLIRTLVDTAQKISNSLAKFNDGVKNFIAELKRINMQKAL